MLIKEDAVDYARKNDDHCKLDAVASGGFVIDKKSDKVESKGGHSADYGSVKQTDKAYGNAGEHDPEIGRYLYRKGTDSYCHSKQHSCGGESSEIFQRLCRVDK